MTFFPEHLDRNEWFIIGSLVAAYGVILRLPRPFPRSISALIMFFSLSLAKGLDDSLGVPPFDLYDTNDTKAFDFTDLLTWSLYPASGYLFIYIANLWRIRGLFIPIFVLISSLAATAFEYVCVRMNVFHYHGWKLLYSFPVYLVTQMTVLLLFFGLKKRWLDIRR